MPVTLFFILRESCIKCRHEPHSCFTGMSRMLLERFVADVLQTNAILDTFESKISLCVLKFVSLFVIIIRLALHLSVSS